MRRPQQGAELETKKGGLLPLRPIPNGVPFFLKLIQSGDTPVSPPTRLRSLKLSDAVDRTEAPKCQSDRTMTT